MDDALRHAPHRRGEALLGGDVRVEEDALKAPLAAALELGLGDHAHGEVGAVARPAFFAVLLYLKPSFTTFPT